MERHNIVSKNDIKEVVWRGDSLDVIRGWPAEVRANIGADVRRLQSGREPLDWKPFPGLAENAFELRESDKNGWYRVVYVTVIKNAVVVLHCFEKDSAKASKRDVALADQRLKELLLEEAEKKKAAKKKGGKK
jgi:phage-related protein